MSNLVMKQSIKCLRRSRGVIQHFFSLAPEIFFGSQPRDEVGKHHFSYSWLALDPGEPFQSLQGVCSAICLVHTVSVKRGGNQEADLEENDQGSKNYLGKKNSLIA